MSIAGWEIAAGVAAGLAVGVLGVAGIQHLTIADPAEDFRRPPARRRALGVVEVILAGLGIAAVVTARALALAGVAFAFVAVAFLAYLAVLRARDPGRSCGCTPYSTVVSRYSFAPAGSVLIAAGVVLGASGSDVSFSGTAERVVLFAVSVLLGWTLLLWVPAAER